jgi:hypothetical protein
MPGESEPDARKRWSAKAGLEIAEEEDPFSERSQDDHTGDND